MADDDQNDPEVTFTGVHVHSRKHVHVSSISDEFAEDRQDHALIFSYVDGVWAHRLVENSICGLCVVNEPKPRVLNIGVDGEVAVFNLPGFDSELIDQSENRPNFSRTLRCVRKIGNRVYAAGMARQVYRRDAPAKWSRVDQGTFVPSGKRKQAVGFNAIDGLTEDEIYAVGYKGEIWLSLKGHWRQVESPTNVVLTGVRCLNSKEVYACGLAGSVLVGFRDQWRFIDQDITSEDFWGIVTFKNEVYLSNYDGLFKVQNDLLVRVDLNLDEDVTTAYLDACKDSMWSVGHKDIVVTSDGKKWIHIPSP